MLLPLSSVVIRPPSLRPTIALLLARVHTRTVDYKTFLAILNRPDGVKPAGTPGASCSAFPYSAQSGVRYAPLDRVAWRAPLWAVWRVTRR